MNAFIRRETTRKNSQTAHKYTQENSKKKNIAEYSQSRFR